MSQTSPPLMLDLSEVGAGDVSLVGGKRASLGELFRALVPQGIAISLNPDTVIQTTQTILEAETQFAPAFSAQASDGDGRQPDVAVALQQE